MLLGQFFGISRFKIEQNYFYHSDSADIKTNTITVHFLTESACKHAEINPQKIYSDQYKLKPTLSLYFGEMPARLAEIAHVRSKYDRMSMILNDANNSSKNIFQMK